MFGLAGGARQRLRGGHVVLDPGRQTGSPIDDLVPAARRIGKAIETVIEGKRDAIQLTLAVLLAEGHLLIEDVPGVGKTMLAKALARAIDGTVRRVQFTPDLLPSATRTSPELRLGASPRATLHLLRASRAWAALDGRDYVIPDDVQRLARPVLAHRLLPTAEAIVERHLPEQVVDRIVAQLALPRR